MAEGEGTPGVVLDPDVLFDEILAKKGPQTYKDGLSEANWEEELQSIPLFTTEIPDEIDPEKAPGLAALQDLKYQEESPEGRALALKDDGNEQFRLKKYQLAVTSYTAGIKEKCDNPSLKAVLYSNRAATHYHLGNYRSSLMDASQAKRHKPDHLKAIVRGAMAAVQLKRFAEALEWCKEGLRLEPENSQLRQLHTTATKEKKRQERDQRRNEMVEKSKSKEEQKILEAIKCRGIRLAEVGISNHHGDESPLSLLSEQAPHPSGGRVHMDEGGALVWPVMFLYPEYGQTDFIESFNENHRFLEHVEVMFQDHAAWDSQQAYTPTNIEIYYEDRSSHTLCSVPMQSTLGEVLSDKRHTVVSGTPSFIILAATTSFKDQFLRRYS